MVLYKSARDFSHQLITHAGAQAILPSGETPGTVDRSRERNEFSEWPFSHERYFLWLAYLSCMAEYSKRSSQVDVNCSAYSPHNLHRLKPDIS